MTKAVKKAELKCEKVKAAATRRRLAGEEPAPEKAAIPAKFVPTVDQETCKLVEDDKYLEYVAKMDKDAAKTKKKNR